MSEEYCIFILSNLPLKFSFPFNHKCRQYIPVMLPVESTGIFITGMCVKFLKILFGLINASELKLSL